MFKRLDADAVGRVKVDFRLFLYAYIVVAQNIKA